MRTVRTQELDHTLNAETYHNRSARNAGYWSGEAYHNRDVRELGYWSGEALQAVFGAEVIKGGVSLVKDGVKAAKASKKIAHGAGATKSVAKAAESIEKGAARATKVEQVAQQAESVGNTAQVANAEGRVERAAKVEQMLQGASEQVQEAYLSEKSWLGEGSITVRNDNKAMVLMSKDGLRKFRFDFDNTTSEGKSFLAHAHLQEFRNAGWRDAIEGIHRIYSAGDWL